MPATAFGSQPLVSIGIPVYNEAAFLEATLASLLKQDYPHIEFIISDNASTDATLEICERAAATDARVRILRVIANDGSTANFRRCIDAARGDLFMWAAGHDLWSCNFVSQSVAALQAHPGAVIAAPESRWIDGDSVPFGCHASILDTRGMDPLARVFTLLWSNMHPIYGLMHTSTLRAHGPVPGYSGSDLVMLARMVLAGDVVPAGGALWSRRQVRPPESMRDRQRRYYNGQFKLAKSLFPLARLSMEVLRSVWSSGLPRTDKLAFTLAFPWLLPARYLVARRRVA